MKNLDLIAVALVTIGAINWGLVGVAKFNLVTALLGTNVLSSIVFTVVGLAGVYLAMQMRGMPRRWAEVPAHV
jgi:uncharacterized membrane protein YuzA (DUF378 family)